MNPDIPWATRIRLALQEFRTRGVPFATAWARVEQFIPTTDGMSGDGLDFIRRAYREGYHRRDVLHGRATLLAERAPELRTVAEAPVLGDPEATCCFGEPCTAGRADGSLMCEPHRDRLHAAMVNVEQGFRTRLNETEPCQVAGCDRVAQRRVPYCAKHDPELMAA